MEDRENESMNVHYRYECSFIIAHHLGEIIGQNSGKRVVLLLSPKLINWLNFEKQDMKETPRDKHESQGF